MIFRQIFSYFISLHLHIFLNLLIIKSFDFERAASSFSFRFDFQFTQASSPIYQFYSWNFIYRPGNIFAHVPAAFFVLKFTASEVFATDSYFFAASAAAGLICSDSDGFRPANVFCFKFFLRKCHGFYFLFRKRAYFRLIFL